MTHGHVTCAFQPSAAHWTAGRPAGMQPGLSSVIFSVQADVVVFTRVAGGNSAASYSSHLGEDVRCYRRTCVPAV